MEEIGSPHDRYFRESFGRLEIARDFLRQNLPEPLLAEIDLATRANPSVAWVASATPYTVSSVEQDCIAQPL